MKTQARTWILLLVLAVGLGCSGDRVEDTEGDVILTVSDFDGLAVQVSVGAVAGNYTIGTLTISNVPKNPRRATSGLMDVEIRTYEVTYARVGGGTQTPTTLVRDVLGLAPINGTVTYTNLPLMGLEQLDNPPLSDLLVENGGFDRETNSQRITLTLTITFFGRTIGGDRVATEPVAFTAEFVP